MPKQWFLHMVGGGNSSGGPVFFVRRVGNAAEYGNPPIRVLCCCVVGVVVVVGAAVPPLVADRFVGLFAVQLTKSDVVGIGRRRQQRSRRRSGRVRQARRTDLCGRIDVRIGVTPPPPVW